MASVLHLGLVLAFSQPAEPHVIETYKVETTAPLSGPDFLLISTAARHPQMRGRNLSCYRISVSRQKGVRTVSFLGVRDDLPTARQGEVILGFRKQNPNCPDRSFEMDDKGRVTRVIYSRH